jgi:REP element-mobilizing transposase RayT
MMNPSTTHARLLPGKIYHVYTRGNNRETIFKHPENYPYFLMLWKRHITPVADTFAYCLLPNHVHFCIRMKPEESLHDKYLTGERHLSQPFSNCFNAYAKAINKRFQRTGSLFEETYRRKEVDNETYFIRLIAYIHANPQHHRLCADFRDYPHSSYHLFLDNQPTDLLRTEIWDCFGERKGFQHFHTDHQNWRSLIENDEDLED